MKFSERGKKLKPADIDRAEKVVGMTFPAPLRKLYLAVNGGVPKLYMFENEDLHTSVTELLRLWDHEDEEASAVATFEDLVKQRRSLKGRFFPFAVDGGGDYFFVDCHTPEGRVHFYDSDSCDRRKMLDLKMSLEEFWESLKPEEPDAEDAD